MTRVPSFNLEPFTSSRLPGQHQSVATIFPLILSFPAVNCISETWPPNLTSHFVFSATFSRFIKSNSAPISKDSTQVPSFHIVFSFFGFYSIDDKISLLSNRGWSLNSLGFLSIDLHSPLPVFLFLRCMSRCMVI